MIDIDRLTGQLERNAEVIRAAVTAFAEESTQWKPDPETWSITQVMDHVYNEERVDFRQRLKEIFQQQSWGSLKLEWQSVPDCRTGLDGFLRERAASLDWLRSLESANWDSANEASFGPGGEKITISAGDVLVSWVEHDYLHLRQMVELLHAWNVSQAAPHSTDYAGGW